MKKKTSVDFPPELQDSLRIGAAIENRTMKELLMDAFAEYLTARPGLASAIAFVIERRRAAGAKQP